MKTLHSAMLIALAMGALPFAARAAAAPAPPAPVRKTMQVGDQIADLVLPDLKGKKTSTAALRHGKVFVLALGATWSGWCNKQIPELNKVVKTYGGQVMVIGVNIREKTTRVKRQNKRLGVEYFTLLDRKGSTIIQYGVQGYPVVIVADKSGKIVFRGEYTRFKVLKAAIDAALNKEAKAGGE